MAGITNTDVSNTALSHIGEKRIADFDDDTATDPATIYCRLHLEKTRDALIRSHLWRFAKKRVKLTSTETPAFEWDYSFELPADFLRAYYIYDGSDTPDGRTTASWELEGRKLLFNSSTLDLKYIRQVTDPNEWDSLFYQVMELQLAYKLVIPLSQDLKLKKDVSTDLAILMRKVRAMDRAEGQKIGRDALKTWNDARFTNIP